MPTRASSTPLPHAAALCTAALLIPASAAVADVAAYREAVQAIDGLLDYYPFDMDFADVVDGGNGLNSGQVPGPPPFAPGLRGEGKAGDFDGRGQFLRILRSVQDDFTLLAWIHTDSPGAGGDLAPFYMGSGLIYADMPGIANDFGATVTGTTFALGVGNPDLTIHSGSPVTTGEWVFLAAVRRVDLEAGTAEVKVYVNGTLEASDVHPNVLPLDAQLQLTIGGNAMDNRYFAGRIDEVALASQAHDDAMILACFQAADQGVARYRQAVAGAGGLVDYYDFEDRHADSHDGGNGFNDPDNLVSDTAPALEGAPSNDFAGALFDGIDDVIIVRPSLRDSFTVLVWMKADFPQIGSDTAQFYEGSGFVYSDVPGIASDYGTAVTGSRFAFGVGNPDQTIRSTTEVTAGEWMQVAAVRDVDPSTFQSELRVYVNGVLEEARSHPNGAPVDSWPTITIGANLVDRRYFAGSIDELALFGVALDDAAVEATYGALLGISPCFTANAERGPAPLAVDFDAGCTRSTDASVSAYDWDFGDGASAQGQKVSHVYASPGIYTAVCRVTTAAGTRSSARRTIVADFASADVSPWTSEDVGDPPPRIRGGERFEPGGCLAVYAGGKELGGRADSFHFVHQGLSGDASVTARVQDLTGPANARAGVMLREDLTPGSRFAAAVVVLSVAGPRVSFVRREEPGASAKPAKQSTLNPPFPDVWLRIERAGGEAIGWVSSDGVAWTEVGRAPMSFPAEVRGGIAATVRDTADKLIAMQATLCDIAGPPRVGGGFHRGDADDNGSLQLTDAIQVLGFLFLGRPAPACLDAGDADDNGSLQITDAVRILSFLFLGGVAPASPGPPPEDCGPDPTGDDGLGCDAYLSC
ncbi:MAG: PKD domain-containing protein [Planctomycetes bacterium]|nr:PKD domain-containing protein [Planctomycetota bacterium]